ncbi:hypothetical protein VTO73DRAFT_6220 [Trametes versicolor]
MIRFLARHSLEPIAIVHDIGTCGRTHTLRRLAAGEDFDQERPVTDLAYPFAMEGNPSCGYICSSGAFSCHPFSSQIEESQTIAGRGRLTRPRWNPLFARNRRQLRQGAPTAIHSKGRESCRRHVLPRRLSPADCAIGGLLGARDGQASAFPSSARRGV